MKDFENIKIMVFCYNFPHKKTQDFLLRLLLEGIKISFIIAADPVKLNIPHSTVRTKIRHIGLVHPKKIAQRMNIDYYVLPHNSKKTSEIIRENNVDLGVIAGARILKKSVIDSFRIGIINFHPGLIPESRGLDAMLWSIYNKVPLGVTAHLIDDRIDAGKILLKRKIPIENDDTLLDLSERLYETEIELLLPAIQNAVSGKWVSVKSDSKLNKKMPPELEKQIPMMLDKYKKIMIKKQIKED